MGFLLYFGGHSHSHNGSTHVHENGGRRRIEIHSSDQNFSEEDERFPLVQTSINLDSDLQSVDEANINLRAAFIHVLGLFYINSKNIGLLNFFEYDSFLTIKGTY